MINEKELNNLAEQYAYYTLGSSPCENCDDFCEFHENCDDFCECFYESNDRCKDAQEYGEKYKKLIEEYKNNCKDGK